MRRREAGEARGGEGGAGVEQDLRPSKAGSGVNVLPSPAAGPCRVALQPTPPDGCSKPGCEDAALPPQKASSKASARAGAGTTHDAARAHTWRSRQLHHRASSPRLLSVLSSAEAWRWPAGPEPGSWQPIEAAGCSPPLPRSFSLSPPGLGLWHRACWLRAGGTAKPAPGMLWETCWPFPRGSTDASVPVPAQGSHF